VLAAPDAQIGVASTALLRFGGPLGALMKPSEERQSESLSVAGVGIIIYAVHEITSVD